LGSCVARFAEVAGVDPSQKTAVLQASIDTIFARPAFIAAGEASGLSAICVFWLGVRNGIHAPQP
jgi:hypothetical protein